MAPNCHQTVTGDLNKDGWGHVSPCFKWSERLDSNQRPLTPQIALNSQVLENATAFSRNKAPFSVFVLVQTVTNCHRTLSVLSAAALSLLLLAAPKVGPLHVTASDATALVTSAAKKHRVPVSFALKMAKIESGVRCGNHNRRTSASGPLQVVRGTARAVGYRGDIRKASCAVQTEYGMRALAMCWRASKGRASLAKRCHQVGISAVYGRRR